MAHLRSHPAGCAHKGHALAGGVTAPVTSTLKRSCNSPTTSRPVHSPAQPFSVHTIKPWQARCTGCSSSSSSRGAAAGQHLISAKQQTMLPQHRQTITIPLQPLAVLSTNCIWQPTQVTGAGGERVEHGVTGGKQTQAPSPQ